MAEILAASIFLLGYIAISLEHRLFVNKAAISLFLGTVLWVIMALVLPASGIQAAISESTADIFSVVIFLLTAMTLVEILVHYHFFDLIENRLRARNWDTYQLGWALAAIAFCFSAFLDNLTTTIVVIQIARRLFCPKDLLRIAAAVVIAANAGGAFSPVGDVTTIMLWFAHKFTATHIILQGFLPSVFLALSAAWMLLRKLPRADAQACNPNAKLTKLSRSDRIVITATLGTFLLPLIAALLNLPPYMGLLAGLGTVWMLIDFAKYARPQPSHLDANIKKLLQHTDIESIQFFIGILLSVAALHALGILDQATDFMFGEAPSLFRMAAGFVGLGLGSAIVDNVPLTAAAISSLQHVSAPLWVLLAITVGTGGSLLVIGSAAGVIAMGMLPNLTFTKYLRIATIPAFIGFVIAVATWSIQYWLIY